MKDKLLFVDDDADQCALIALALDREGFDVRTTTSASEAFDIVEREDPSVILTDLGMNEMTGLELCERILARNANAIVIVVTGQATMEAAITAMRVGAFDFLTKPLDPKLLSLAVARATKHRRLGDEIRRLRGSSREHPGMLIGESTAMRRVYDLLSRVSGSDASVLIQGETGTGKEIIARAVHAMSDRKSGPFVAVNCAAVPQTLLESELFGHARGAFTDAKQARQGLFLQATGGTLFLDEIGEMPLDVQPKLLRSLEERRVRPVGETSEVPFDARLVVATNRDLESDVNEKRFREDLYYRINVVKVDLPPLRDRGADVLALAAHFLEEFTRNTDRPLTLPIQIAECLMGYDWPGNVRELKNCIERAVALARSDRIALNDLPEKVRNHRLEHLVDAADSDEIVKMEEIERRYLLRVLKLVNGNKARAAQKLGLDRRTLYRKLERYQRGDRPDDSPHAAAAVAGYPESGPT